MALPLQGIAHLLIGSRLLRLHRLGPRLQDEELSISAIEAPFDVHGPLVVALDDHGVLGQIDHLLTAERIAIAILHADIHRLNSLARGTALFIRGEDHLDKLAANLATDHRHLAGLEHGLVHIKLIGVHCALHHGLAQAVGARDEDHLVKARLRVECEHHAGSTKVGSHHALNASREGNIGMGKTLVNPVADGPIVVERGKDMFDLVEHILDAHHIQEGFLLARKGGVRQVFSRGR